MGSGASSLVSHDINRIPSPQAGTGDGSDSSGDSCHSNQSTERQGPGSRSDPSNRDGGAGGEEGNETATAASETIVT